jgi:glycosyltransferase involved in cell wall biosynthesis
VARTPEAVGIALCRLANQPNLRKRLGSAARRRAASLTWQRSVDTVIDLYRGILKQDAGVRLTTP